mmetsp:Transcript_14466/g.24744  ORF Transcript_14466/g.24744 Transcript_14466/m.24744 type:complete len:91 (+) Transcript_14466:65-337(+)
MARIFVGELSEKISEQELEDMFAKFGHIRKISMKAGFGFVDYDDHRDADDAVRDMDGVEVEGRRLRVEIARGRDRRMGGGGGGGGRGERL